jgi:hypothetical protein
MKVDRLYAKLLFCLTSHLQNNAEFDGVMIMIIMHKEKSQMVMKTSKKKIL